MRNRIITPAEIGRVVLGAINEHANQLPPEKRESFMRACASWLSGGVYR